MIWKEVLFNEFNKTFIRDNRYKVFVTGFKNTVMITLISLCMGLVAGTLIAIARHGFAKMKPRKNAKFSKRLAYRICFVVDKILALYVSIMRGVPGGAIARYGICHHGRISQ